jgi:hypothetical protein
MRIWIRNTDLRFVDLQKQYFSTRPSLEARHRINFIGDTGDPTNARLETPRLIVIGSRDCSVHPLPLKVHKNENFLAPILNFVLFHF